MKVNDSGVKVMCCGEEMGELVPNSTDAAQEKHVPVVTVADGKVAVQVGSTLHPMEEKHYIEWIYLVTEGGCQARCLKPGDEPKAEFVLADGDKAVTVFAYCNLHGLWKTDL